MSLRQQVEYAFSSRFVRVTCNGPLVSLSPKKNMLQDDRNTAHHHHMNTVVDVFYNTH